MIFLISDTHFNHNKEFIYKPRGFNNIEEMNTTIISKWNEKISRDDDVYVLGDFFLGTDIEFIKTTLPILNGKIHLIIGNHDTPAKINLYKQFDNIVEIVYSTQIKFNNRLFYLSHYPTLTADLNSNPDTSIFNLFGHTHSKDTFYEERPYMYNVAVDAHDNEPISIEAIYYEINEKIKDCLSYLV